MEQAVLKTSSEIEDSSDVGARKGVSKTGQPKTTPKGKRKYTSYRKLEDESDQNTFDEALVSLVMDKPELYNMKLDTSKKTREKVALAWIDIQESLKAGDIDSIYVRNIPLLLFEIRLLPRRVHN